MTEVAAVRVEEDGWREGETEKEWKEGETEKEWREGETEKEWREGETEKEWRESPGETKKEWRESSKESEKEWRESPAELESEKERKEDLEEVEKERMKSPVELETEKDGRDSPGEAEKSWTGDESVMTGEKEATVIAREREESRSSREDNGLGEKEGIVRDLAQEETAKEDQTNGTAEEIEIHPEPTAAGLLDHLRLPESGGPASDVSSVCSEMEEISLGEEGEADRPFVAAHLQSTPPAGIPAPVTRITRPPPPAVIRGEHTPPPSSPARQLHNTRLRSVANLPKSYSSPSLTSEVGCFGFRGEDYYSNCAQIVAEAKQRERAKDFKGAEGLLKAAVEVLIAGVQRDPDPIRREGVRRRTAEYLQLAESLAAQHGSARRSRRPATMTGEQLAALRVTAVRGSVMIVESPKSGNVHVLKTLRKPLNCGVSGQSVVVRAPYLVPLVRYCLGDHSVWLLLKRIHGSELPVYVGRFLHSTPLPATLRPAANGAVGESDPALERQGSVDQAGETGSKVPLHLIRKWAAQLVVCLSALHRQGLVYADLHPGNVLIDDFSNLNLTYITQLPGLHHRISNTAVQEMYVAPEVLSGLNTVTPAADWWSLGALLFYLFTGHPLSEFYPYQSIKTSKLRIPSEEQSGGSSLVSGLLKFSPSERLGAGVMGSEELRSHSFFSSIRWDDIV